MIRFISHFRTHLLFLFIKCTFSRQICILVIVYLLSLWMYNEWPFLISIIVSVYLETSPHNRNRNSYIAHPRLYESKQKKYRRKGSSIWKWCGKIGFCVNIYAFILYGRAFYTVVWIAYNINNFITPHTKSSKHMKHMTNENETEKKQKTTHTHKENSLLFKRSSITKNTRKSLEHWFVLRGKFAINVVGRIIHLWMVFNNIKDIISVFVYTNMLRMWRNWSPKVSTEKCDDDHKKYVHHRQKKGITKKMDKCCKENNARIERIMKGVNKYSKPKLHVCIFYSRTHTSKSTIKWRNRKFKTHLVSVLFFVLLSIVVVSNTSIFSVFFFLFVLRPSKRLHRWNDVYRMRCDRASHFEHIQHAAKDFQHSYPVLHWKSHNSPQTAINQDVLLSNRGYWNIQCDIPLQTILAKCFSVFFSFSLFIRTHFISVLFTFWADLFHICWS